MTARLGLRVVALGYLTMLLALPVGLIFWRTFENGFDPVWQTLHDPGFLHALWLTILIAAIAVPANAIFGVICAFVLVRQRFHGKRILNALIDLPFALSPVVVGLSLVLVYGRHGWLGEWFEANGIRVIFAVPGMVLATIFISLPFVVREVMPVLREVGKEQDEAAWTLGASPFATFWRVTLPAIRWGITYGVVLTTARALGEFGAVSVVSGKIEGRTETLTLHVQNSLENFDRVGAYTASVVLAFLAVLTLLAMNLFRRKEAPDGDRSAPSQQAVR
jgi:sulfate/thiosulfate transport system permease protein